MTSTHKEENQHVSTLGGTSGERDNLTSCPKAIGSCEENEERDEMTVTHPTQQTPPEPPDPPEPPKPPDEKEKMSEQKDDRNSMETENEENKEERSERFPPEAIGAQVMIPSLSDLNPTTEPKNDKEQEKDQGDDRFPPDCLGSQIIMPTFADVQAGTIVDPEYGEESDTERGTTNERTPSARPKQTVQERQTNWEKKKLEKQARIERATALKKQQLEKLENFNKIFKGGDWAVYLYIKTESKINVTQMERHLLNISPSEEMMVRRCYGKENEFIIKTTSRVQSEAFLKIRNIKGMKAEVTKHSELNSVWGSILILDLEDNDEETYLDILKNRCRSHTVEEVKLITLKREKRDLNILKIKFKGEEMPEKIYIEGRVKEVRPFIPRPVQCHGCLIYGHFKDRCRSGIIRCNRCGELDHGPGNTCEAEEKCYNCGGTHNAKSNKCKFHDYYTQIKLLQIRTGLSVREAKIVLKSKNIHDPYVKPLYSQMARSSATSPQMGEQGANKKDIRKSPGGSRFEPLTRITDTWEEQAGASQKRGREAISPQPQRIAVKKIKDRSHSTESLGGKSESKRKENERKEKNKEMEQAPMEMEQSGESSQQEEPQKIETVINRKTFEGSWADTSYESDQDTQRFETKASSTNDLQGVMKEMANYKQAMKEQDKISQSLSDSLPSLEKADQTQKKGNKEEKQEATEAGKEKYHDQECSCERCMYRDVRELKYKTDRNISLVIDVYMGKPAQKDLKHHPSDCLCGAHLKQLIKGKRTPYSKIIGTIRYNKFKPPK